MLHIRHFSLDSGFRPFEAWVSSLDKRSKAKVRAYVDRVALGGSKKNIRSLGHGLNKIKIDFGPGLRVYYGVIDNEIMLLLGGAIRAASLVILRKHTNFGDITNAST